MRKFNWILVFSFLIGIFVSVPLFAEMVTRVVDGDTLVLNNGEKVRLIGVDTPETKHPRKPVQYFGKEASAFTKKLCESREVRLEYDHQLRDRYNRLLAYVYLKNGVLVNKEIILKGFGYAYTKYPFKKMEEFKAAEWEARTNQRGLWKGDQHETIQ